MLRRCLTLLASFATLSAAAAAATPAVATSSAPALLMTKEATGWTSGNWSGYAGSTGAAGSATSVEGYWEVPSVSKTSKNTYSSTWVGIDGFGNSDLIQTGVEQAWVGGAAKYTAWWEILPASQTNIPSLVVHPGDVMFAYIAKQTGSTWEIELEDTTTGKSFVTDETYTGVADTVEWIVEAPTVGGSVSTLATYSTMYFDKDAFNGFYAAFTTANRGVMIQGGKHVSTPSKPDSDEDGFAVAHGAKTPPPPAS